MCEHSEKGEVLWCDCWQRYPGGRWGQAFWDKEEEKGVVGIKSSMSEAGNCDECQATYRIELIKFLNEWKVLRGSHLSNVMAVLFKHEVKVKFS